MKLIDTYDKIIMNEIFDAPPYPYNITNNDNGWYIRFTAKSRTTNTTLDYKATASLSNYSVGFTYEGRSVYSQGYKEVSISFESIDNSGYHTLTNMFDNRIIGTIAQAVKKIVLEYDIQKISFSGVSKDGDENVGGLNSRNRVYVICARLIKPDNYIIKAQSNNVAIYQDPDYYDQKRHIGAFANTTNTATTPTTVTANTAQPRVRTSRTPRRTVTPPVVAAPPIDATRRVAPRYDDNGNLISGSTGVTTISPTAPPQARTPRVRRPVAVVTPPTTQNTPAQTLGRSQEVYAERRPEFTYEIYKSQKSQNATGQSLLVQYVFKDEINFRNMITIQSAPMAEFSSLERIAQTFGINTSNWDSNTTIANVTLITKTSSHDRTYIYRYLRTLLTKVGEYRRLIRKTDKAIVIHLPPTNLEYGTALMKDPNFIKLKNWYISKTLYNEYHNQTTLVFVKKS